ncbi:putative YEATS family [Trypanosoma cruzi]|nr:putative YEATS family [Trypanosoma cruzi]
MRHGDRGAAAVEQEHVLYTGAMLIPFCVGSVALPLSLCRASSSSPLLAAPPSVPRRKSKTRRRGEKKNQQGTSHEGDGNNPHDYNAGISRCTHIRYSYLRDGSSAAQDLAYRRALYTSGDVRMTSVSTSEKEKAVTTASQLYAVVDRVVFKLPNSFPEPRREVRHPPFFVVDDTWAEHLVEMEVHFHPWLGIAPFTVSHMVLLQKRADFTPQLLSSTFGQTKPSPTVILESSDTGVLPSSSLAVATTRRHSKQRVGPPSEGHPLVVGEHDTGNDEFCAEERGICVKFEDLEEFSIVSERRDAIRIFHPTLNVARFLATVRTMAQPELEPPPSFCVFPKQKSAPSHVQLNDENVHTVDCCRTAEKRNRSNDTDGENHSGALDGGLLPPWCFPFEAIMHAHEPKRRDGALDAMRAVLAALRKEQSELREGIEQKISLAMNNAEELRGVIQKMRETCAILEKPVR